MIVYGLAHSCVLPHIIAAKYVKFPLLKTC